MIKITNRQLELMMEINGLRRELSITVLKSSQKEIEERISNLLIALSIE